MIKIGIAGIGGIGSNVARHLAQARVEEIKIVDFDRVEASNLNRQFYRFSQVGHNKTDSLRANLMEIFPEIRVENMEQKIIPGDAGVLFADCGLVVEGLDDKKLKKMLIEELGDSGKVVVSASGIAGTDMKGVQIKTMGNCSIVGDFTSDQDDLPIFPPKITMIASIMAGIILQYVQGETYE